MSTHGVEPAGFTYIHALQEHIRQLHTAMQLAEDVFTNYARGHEAKGTEDGRTKARINQHHAAKLRHARLDFPAIGHVPDQPPPPPWLNAAASAYWRALPLGTPPHLHIPALIAAIMAAQQEADLE